MIVDWLSGMGSVCVVAAVLLSAGLILLIIHNGRLHRQLLMEQDRSRTMLHFDPLSGLPNRTYLLEELNLLSAESDESGALFLINIDHFTHINDTFGPTSGDWILKEVGVRLQALVPPEATVYRLGGDEFVVLMQEVMSERDTTQFAARLIKGFKSPFNMGNSNSLHISISIGISLFPQHASNVEDLLTSADVALYQAKKGGKGFYTVYDTSMQLKLRERMEIEKHLLYALDYDELELHYQPQVDAVSEKIVGFEALLRWNSPKLGRVSPDKFIPIAEESRLIIPIGEWVLITACEFLSRVHEQGFRDCKISVNLSVMQLKQDNFLDTVSELLEQSGIEPEYIEIEITESLLMESSEREHLVTKLNRLRTVGIGIALDDFGTGYSSLSYLQVLPITILKMDKQFLAKTEEDEASRSLASIILLIGHRLGLTIVAEGVETTGQLAFLREHECDLIQGYLYSMPLPEQDALSLLASWRT